MPLRMIEDSGLGKSPVGAVGAPPSHRLSQKKFPLPWREGVRGKGTRSASALTLSHLGEGKSRGAAAALCCGLMMIFLVCVTHQLQAAQITDDRGAAVTMGAPPQRIISLYGGLTEILGALGVADRVVARIQGDETIQGIPTVGTHLQPNVEMILALKPDLVVQGGVAKGMPALARLEAAKVPVAMFAPRDFAGLFSTITRLGALTGRVEEASALTQSMEAKLAGVAKRVAGRPRPRVFFEVRELNLLAAGQGSLVNDIITRAGGENLVTSPHKLTLYSLEALIQANPEVYIIQQGPMNRSPEDIYARPYFQELKAVKAHRVLVVSESLYSRPGPRSAEAVEQLAKFLHPEAWGKP
jgi:iron complex transport system substrate-binding protein